MARAARLLPFLAASLALLAACPPTSGVVTCQEDEECLAGSFCVEGKCASCPACGQHETCVRGTCRPTACGDVPCHQGESCEDGRCLSEDCLKVSCPSGQACARGSCYPVECGEVSCTAASVCAEAACTVNACAEVQCKAGEACADGSCRPQSCSGVICASGAVCEQGSCVEASCVGVVCRAGTLCSDGRCKAVRCSGAATDCPAHQACVGGVCKDLRCEGMTCPPGRTCEASVCVACEGFEVRCADGVDEDCNGTTDCADPACEGESCDDGDPASVQDVCTAQRTCAGRAAATCDTPPNDCHGKNGLLGADGKCEYPFKAKGAACAATGPCVSGGSCDGAGQCQASAADCSTPPGPCWGAGSCNAGTGQCQFPPLQGGAPCDDGDRCTTGDACDGAGACKAAKVTCTSPQGSCYESVGSCNPATGACQYAFKAPGTACKETVNLCTVGDACDGSGRCVSGPEKTCAPPASECQDPGSCFPTTGDCVYPSKADGTACPSNPCRTCAGGQCVTNRDDGTLVWGAAVCCGGIARDTATDPAHCGGCDTPCAPGRSCESVDQTPACSSAPAGTSGRCTCNGANAECPRGQVCRTYTPYSNRCTPNDGNACFSGQYQDVSGCPNYCVPHCATGLGVPEPWLAMALAALQLTCGLRRRRER